MTPDLLRKLNARDAPFDGRVLYSTEGLVLPQLRHLLITVTDYLAGLYPSIEVFHDWHEHDGFLTDADAISWERIRDTLASDELLYRSRNDDFEVRVAIATTTFDWLLRYNIDPEDESNMQTAHCDFDLTVRESLWESILSRLKFDTKLVSTSEAGAWFDSNAGG